MANKTFKLLILIMEKLKLNKLTFHLLKRNFKKLSKTLLLIVIDFLFFLFKKYKILKYEVQMMVFHYSSSSSFKSITLFDFRAT